jgi:excisionase family DNA binding protein
VTESDHNAIEEVRELAGHALRRVKSAAELSPRLLDLADSARYLSVGDKTLRELIRKGEIDYIQLIPRKSPYLLDVRDLDRWIERAKVRIDSE